ncbi:MAG: ribonuclease P protein subunit [archaeon]
MMIGKHIKIKSANSLISGMQGVVVDETKHTLIIDTSKGRKTLIKNTLTIEEAHNA